MACFGHSTFACYERKVNHFLYVELTPKICSLLWVFSAWDLSVYEINFDVNQKQDGDMMTWHTKQPCSILCILRIYINWSGHLQTSLWSLTCMATQFWVCSIYSVGTQHTTLWNSCVEHYGVWSTFSHPHHLGPACEEAQYPLTEAEFQSQGAELGLQSVGSNGGKCWSVVSEQQIWIIPLYAIHMHQGVM